MKHLFLVAALTRSLCDFCCSLMPAVDHTCPLLRYVSRRTLSFALGPAGASSAAVLRQRSTPRRGELRSLPCLRSASSSARACGTSRPRRQRWRTQLRGSRCRTLPPLLRRRRCLSQWSRLCPSQSLGASPSVSRTSSGGGASASRECSSAFRRCAEEACQRTQGGTA